MLITRFKTILIHIIIVVFLFLLFPSSVEAVTIEISNPPVSISSDPFSVDVFISGPTPATNYLRIDLYKEGTTNYFGETFNGSNWYGGSSGTSYFSIEIGAESTASASIQGRMGDPSLSEYPGPGQYKLRIRRYTASGSSASDVQTPVDVQITMSTQESDSTSETTANPSESPSSTPKLTVKAKATSKPKVIDEESDENGEDFILGLREELKTDAPSSESEGKKKFPVLAGFFIVGGLGSIGFAGYSFIKNKRKKYNGVDDNIQQGNHSEGL